MQLVYTFLCASLTRIFHDHVFFFMIEIMMDLLSMLLVQVHSHVDLPLCFIVTSHALKATY